MNISETNKLWLEKAATRYEVPPEALLDAILARLRHHDGVDEQNLADWLDSPDQTLAEIRNVLRDLQKACGDAGSAAKATRLYLSLIETNKPQS